MLSISVPPGPEASLAQVAEAQRLIERGPSELLGEDWDPRLIATTALDENFHDIKRVRLLPVLSDFVTAYPKASTSTGKRRRSRLRMTTKMTPPSSPLSFLESVVP